MGFKQDQFLQLHYRCYMKVPKLICESEEAQEQRGKWPCEYINRREKVYFGTK